MSGQVVLRKKVAQSEALKGFVRIPNSSVKLFPRGAFRLIVGNKELTKRIDRYNRIFFGVSEIAKAGDEIVFWKKPDGGYEVQVQSHVEPSTQAPQPT